MSKELLKKLQLGVLSFAAVGLLAACGTDDMDEDPVDVDPDTEEVDEVDEVEEEEEVDEVDEVEDEEEDDAS